MFAHVKYLVKCMEYIGAIINIGRHISPKLKKDTIEQLKIGSITNSRKLLAALKTQFTDNDLRASGLIKEETGNLKVFTPCLIFPFYDTHGNLIALQSRYLAESSNGSM